MEEAVHKIGFGVFQILLSLFCGAIWVKPCVLELCAVISVLYLIRAYIRTLQLVEAFEVMILSVLSAALKCDWDLDEVQMATITTVTSYTTMTLCSIV